MNEVFLIGKVIEKVEYKFMLEKNRTAKAKIKLELIDKTKLEVIAYNETADYSLQNFKNKDKVFIYGKLRTNEVECKYIEKL